MKIFGQIDFGIEKLAWIILVFSMALILLLSISIIVLRWADLSFPWMDPFVRHLVFLSAFMGGTLATGTQTHISIDILERYFESKKMLQASLWAKRMIFLISCLTLLWLLKVTLDFVSLEAKYGKEVFLGIHSKVLVSVIPFGTGLISYRFFYLFLSSFFEVKK